MTKARRRAGRLPTANQANRREFLGIDWSPERKTLPTAVLRRIRLPFCGVKLEFWLQNLHLKVPKQVRLPCRQSWCMARFLLPDMGRRRVDCFYASRSNNNVFRERSNVVNDAEVETLRGITHPPCVVAPVNGEPEQKLPLLQSVYNS